MSPLNMLINKSDWATMRCFIPINSLKFTYKGSDLMIKTIPPIAVIIIANQNLIESPGKVLPTPSPISLPLMYLKKTIEHSKNTIPIKKYFKFMFIVLFPKKFEMSFTTAPLTVSPFNMLVNKRDQLISHGLLLFNIRVARRVFIGENV